LLTLSQVQKISGAEGRFNVEVLQHPRYVDLDKCIACGLCAEKCPQKVTDAFNAELVRRKAIYLPYAQAVPLKYAIDAASCIYFKNGKCKACQKFCPAGAINFDDGPKRHRLTVGSIILAPGFAAFDPAGLDCYGYGRLADVVTSLQFERLLSATGPTGGHLQRPSSLLANGQKSVAPHKIAWLQCVGSRDLNRCARPYCSSVCCMAAVKQAMLAREHSAEPLTCAIFYMDLRTQGKDFDRYVDSAAKAGVRFIRARVHSVLPVSGTDDLSLRYVTLEGRIMQEDFDLVVLSVGLGISPQMVELAGRLGVDLDSDGFVRTDGFHPVSTRVPGIYACGSFTGPKDIPQSVMQASAAACAATEKLHTARHTRTRVPARVPERSLARQVPRIGVFVCNCGINIGGVVRVPEVARFARSLKGVVHVEENLFTCSADTQEKIVEAIDCKNLNRIVVAACSPRTHEGLFQETLMRAGLNKFLLEMANIRNQDAWVHAADPQAATAKAKVLVAMAVAKAALLTPLIQSELPVSHCALVVGGGVAGMSAALALARQGYPVHLLEKAQVLGGQARHLHRAHLSEDAGRFVKDLIRQVEDHTLISVHPGAQIVQVEGFVGNFQTRVTEHDSQIQINHGVAILATGAMEYRPKEFLHGSHPAVVTHLEMDALFRNHDPRLARAESIAFIQCVGSRNSEHPYCSKVCCTHTLNSALALKELDPEKNVYVLYRDIRVYGTGERLYQAARQKGILFFPYTPQRPPKVSARGQRVLISFEDPILGRAVCAEVDLLCLATAMVSACDHQLARFFKVSMDADGWLLEAHQKLRPVEFAVDGVFLCGLAHYPKPMEESIAQALAAASRASTILSRDAIRVGGQVARIDAKRCSGCLGCIELCPYGAISVDPVLKKAKVNPALCKGCGACSAACPDEAVTLMGFDARQIYAQLKSALAA
jgi:heterodisulfide reductase subunit A